MSLVPSLLRAIVTIDGEALVLHVGDKPYVLSSSGQVDLAPRGLSYDAVAGVIAQLLPEASQKTLQEYGAAEHELTNLPEFPGEQFNIVAARGGDDVWVEIRRRYQGGVSQVASEPAVSVTPQPVAPVSPAPSGVELVGGSGWWPAAAPPVESASITAAQQPASDDQERQP